MGYTGHIVVSRSRDAAPALWEQERGGGWWWLQLDGESPGILDAVVAATGAPAVVAFVLDSDVAQVDALTPGGLRWQAYLNPGTAAQFGAPPLPLTVDEIVAAALEWSAEAGLTADADAVREALEADATEAEDLFDDLVTALGVPQP